MNTVKTTEKQQAACGIITEMNQAILFLLILNLLNTRQLSKRFRIRRPENNDQLTNSKVVIPLKHLIDFWRALNIPLINFEVELILTWSKNCVLADMTVNADADLAIVAPSGATFNTKEAKLYVSVVTLSKENDLKLWI